MIRTGITGIALVVLLLAANSVGTGTNDTARVIFGLIILFVGCGLLAYLEWADGGRP